MIYGIFHKYLSSITFQFEREKCNELKMQPIAATAAAAFAMHTHLVSEA